MSKVTVLAIERDRENALEHLRELGLLHLEAVRTIESEDVETARKEVEYVRAALELLPRVARSAPTGRPAGEVVRDVWHILHRRKEIADELDALRHEQERIRPLGRFDPAAVRQLAARGVHLRLYQLAAKDRPEVPPEVVAVEVGREGPAVYWALIRRSEPPQLDAREVRLPEMSLDQIEQRIADLEREDRELAGRLEQYAAERPAVEALANEAEDRRRLAEARAAMGSAGASIVYLRGYCPVERLDRLRASAARHGWGLVVEEPSADDRVPTLLRLPSWAKPIEPLMRFIGILPGYQETDISGAFLIFFGLFFAMLVGDAGYGLLFLGATLWARARRPAMPRQLVRLLLAMSGATVVWGALTGTWFGAQPATLPRVDWLADGENVKRLCFGIALVHLSLAHLWNMVRLGRSAQSLAQLGWLGITWTMFFFANTMVLGAPFPRAMLSVFAVSLALVVLFMTPLRQLKNEWFNHVMLPLNVVSNFVDVVSYIRLYAVGTASFAVADNLNRMLAPMLGSWRTALLGVLFLVLAHALNIALALMGVMVHGVRLNTLEFSGHIGLQWTGLPYRPFCRVRDEAADPET
ncbi:MAG: hypothetical protein N2652_11880 [Kiritimatiellae bacterium]|nr:hypothetical protein [Kiritimatiellia bacterium]